MLTEEDYLITRNIDSRTGFIEFKSVLRHGFIQNIKPNQKLTTEVENRIYDKLNASWNEKLYGDIRDSLAELHSNVAHGETNDIAVLAELANIKKLCQIMPDQK